VETIGKLRPVVVHPVAVDTLADDDLRVRFGGGNHGGNCRGGDGSHRRGGEKLATRRQAGIGSVHDISPFSAGETAHCRESNAARFFGKDFRGRRIAEPFAEALAE
jgi:hypothetical protein